MSIVYKFLLQMIGLMEHLATTDCGRPFPTSVDRYINDFFRMFNRHLSLNILRLCPLVIESFPLNHVKKYDVTEESYFPVNIL